MAEVLLPFRARIEELDQDLAVLIAERLRVCAEVAQVKKSRNIPMMQPDRVAAVRASYGRRGAELGVSAAFMENLAELIIDEACRLENVIIGDAQLATEDAQSNDVG